MLWIHALIYLATNDNVIWLFSHNKYPVTVTDESYVCWSVLLGLTALSRASQNHRPAYKFPDMQEIVLMYTY